MMEKLNVEEDLTSKIDSAHIISDFELGTLVPDELPEGGWRAWGCVAGAFCIQMVGPGLSGSFGVYQDYYTRFYITEETPSAISRFIRWIGSVNAFILAASSIVAGRLYDKGYFYHLLYGGSSLMVFSLFMLSLSQPNHIYQNFLSQGVGHGLGAGLIYVPSMAVLSRFFLKKRTLAMSIAVAGTSLGSIVNPIMLNNLFLKFGFGNAAKVNAGMNAGLLLIACLLLRTRQPPVTTVPPMWKSAKRFSTDWPYVFGVLGIMLMPIGEFFPLFYIQLDAVKRGLSENFAFYSLVILNAASFFGRVSPGFSSKFIPILVVICTFASSVLIYAIIGITTAPAFIAFEILFGYFSGALLALVGPLISILSHDISEIGLRMGIAFAMYGLGALLGPPVQGALLGESFVWWKPAVFTGSLCLLATAIFGMMTVLLRRKKESLARGKVDILEIDDSSK